MQRKYALLNFILQMRAIKLARFKWLSLEAQTFLPTIHTGRIEVTDHCPGQEI